MSVARMAIYLSPAYTPRSTLCHCLCSKATPDPGAGHYTSLQRPATGSPMDNREELPQPGAARGASGPTMHGMKPGRTPGRDNGRRPGSGPPRAMATGLPAGGQSGAQPAPPIARLHPRPRGPVRPLQTPDPPDTGTEDGGRSPPLRGPDDPRQGLNRYREPPACTESVHDGPQPLTRWKQCLRTVAPLKGNQCSTWPGSPVWRSRWGQHRNLESDRRHRANSDKIKANRSNLFYNFRSSAEAWCSG